MRTFKYILMDGTTDIIVADFYEKDGADYVFYLNQKVVLRIPVGWLKEKIKEIG